MPDTEEVVLKNPRNQTCRTLLRPAADAPFEEVPVAPRAKLHTFRSRFSALTHQQVLNGVFKETSITPAAPPSE